MRDAARQEDELARSLLSRRLLRAAASATLPYLHIAPHGLLPHVLEKPQFSGLIYPLSSWRAITMRWTWLVPS